MGLLFTVGGTQQVIRETNVTAATGVQVDLSPTYPTVAGYVVVGLRGETANGQPIVAFTLTYTTNHVIIKPDVDAALIVGTILPSP